MKKKRGAWGEAKALWATILFGWAARLDVAEVVYLSDCLVQLSPDEPGRVRFYKDAGGFIVPATTSPTDVAAARAAEIGEGINCGR